jgi:SAM-dependent methyltransferase
MSEPELDGDPSQSVYVLGHSDHELVRLAAQARLIDPITRGFFVDAGIGPDMRVLDVGSGAGDVAFLAAELVGPGGSVVGIERSAAALVEARRRAEQRALENVSFVEGDLDTTAVDGPFDAVVGRYVLQFQSDPAAALRSLRPRVRAGGIVVFHELDWTGAGSFPPAPVYDAACARCMETLRRTGTERHMGAKLDRAFVDAGLAPPALRLEGLVGGGRDRGDVLGLIARLTITLAPEMVRLGVVTEEELAADSLHERMLADASEHGSVIMGNWQIGAWTPV